MFEQPYSKSVRTSSNFIVKPIRAATEVYKSVQMPKWSKDLMSTNVYAEVRGKYARAPILNMRPLSCKNNAPVSFFKSPEKENPARHHTILDARRKRLRRKNSSQSPIQDPEVVDKDIKELTRLLKIERLKRLIVQKRLEIQDSN